MSTEKEWNNLETHEVVTLLFIVFLNINLLIIYFLNNFAFFNLKNICKIYILFIFFSKYI